MTEKDLLRYRKAMTSIERAKEVLREFESKLYSPSISNYSGMPPCGDTQDARESGREDKHDALKRIVEMAEKNAADELAKLSCVYCLLSGFDAEYFNARYIRGESPRDIERALFVSKSTVVRARRRILDMVRGIKQ